VVSLSAGQIISTFGLIVVLSPQISPIWLPLVLFL
jgi:hypothetical protein